jgi:hypothetical protein
MNGENSNGDRDLPRKLAVASGKVVGHGTAVLLLSLGTAFLVAGQSGLGWIWASRSTPGDPLMHEPLRVLLHVGLNACLWALFCIGLAWWRTNRKKTPKRLVARARGTVLTEFLIILVPFLGLTSGLAQLAILNITTVLGHVAVYQAARTAWVWWPETERQGRSLSPNEVEDRARVAAALVLAPTAPSDFSTTSPGSINLQHARGMMYAWSEPGFTRGGAALGPASSAVSGGRANALNELQSYKTSFDSGTFEQRAARKLSFAYTALQPFRAINAGGRTTVAFNYQMNVVFPWFAYIWGDQGTVAGRDGYFIPIRRSLSLEEQWGFR